LRRAGGDPRRERVMRRFSYPPVGGKTHSAKGDRDANTTRISKRPTAFNRPLFQQIHRYISSLDSDKFVRVFSLVLKKIVAAHVWP